MAHEARPRLALLPLILAAAPACRPSPAPVAFPGAPVVLVSIDTLRSDRLPAYGYGGVETPHLDRLRRDAILFESAWSPCPMTLPSHVTMLTGLLPPEHGVRNNVGFTFDGHAHAHLPGLLKARGYATAAAVSSYVLRGETGLAPLFDAYEDSLDPRSGSGFADQQRPGTLTAACAKRWIGEHAAQPFLYFFHLYEPHVPWNPPEPFRSRYPHAYDGEVAAADAVVGDLLDFLREAGLYERAVVVVTSDHGEGLLDHGEEQHSILLYREAIQVPLLLKLPGQRRAGETVEAPVQLADIAPTLAELVGVLPPRTASARSLLRASAGGTRGLYAETLYPRLHLGWSELQSIVDGRFHYIHGPRPELYDVTADPGEIRDIAAREPQALERLRAALARVPSGPAAPARVDPDVAERLNALGYLGTARDRGAGASLPNPRDMLPQLERMKQAFQLTTQRRLAEAAELLSAVVREAPANVEAWIKLGEVQLELGRFAAAATSFEAALARAGMELGDVRVELGYARLRNRELREAEAAAQRALATLPAQALELQARVELARGRLPEARRHADGAVAVRNPQPASWLVGAEVRTAQGDYAGALARLTEAERRAQALGLDSVYNLEALRADALARSGRPQEAEAAYRREAAAFPGNLIAQANLAALLFAGGRRQGALVVLDQMVAANPHPRARQVAAVTLEAVGDKAMAARYRR
jgi:arylsulfatase A-like enzyme/tetratricopeptide (TPR) repeat protein